VVTSRLNPVDRADLDRHRPAALGDEQAIRTVAKIARETRHTGRDRCAIVIPDGMAPARECEAAGCAFCYGASTRLTPRRNFCDAPIV
jgi:hypothetical protein